MDNRQRSSSNDQSIIRPLLAFSFAMMILVGGCQKMERNGTFDSWADQMEHNSR